MDTRGWILERINLKGRKRLRDWLDKFGEMAKQENQENRVINYAKVQGQKEKEKKACVEACVELLCRWVFS